MFARLDSFTDNDVKKKIEEGQYAGEGTVSDDLGILTLPSGEVQHLEVEDGTYTPLVSGADITKVTIGKEGETSANYAVLVNLDSEGAGGVRRGYERACAYEGQDRHHPG